MTRRSPPAESLQFIDPLTSGPVSAVEQSRRVARLVIGIHSETKDREAGSSQNYTDPRAQVKGVDANTVELAVTIQ